MAEAVKPKIASVELSDTYGKIIIEPLERGFGVTLGNALRRVLLSSIPGAAVTRVRFDGHYHEYGTIKGVKESILEIILNIKEMAIRLEDAEKRQLTLSAKGPRQVRASDIEVPAGVEIINKDLPIATLSKDAKLAIEMEVEPGMGYRPAERNKREDSPLEVLPIDSDFSPVKWVNFKVEDTRVGERTDYERLILELETNGGIKPEEAMSQASCILIEHFQLLSRFAAHPFGPPLEAEGEPKELLARLEELDFDTRACNLLSTKGIVTLSDLLQKTEAEIMDIHKFGAKSLKKVKVRLAELSKELGYPLALRSSPAPSEAKKE